MVANTELSIPADDIDKIKGLVLNEIDDFLLVASFAINQRTTCLGWSASDKNSHTKFYRGNHTFPQSREKDDPRNEIIDISDFQDFMKTGYAAFLDFENKLALRNSIYAAVPLESRALESFFLNLFAGLETIILDFRRREKLEFILPESTWPDFRKYLEKCIKESTEPKLEKEQRKLIYSKLCELNRISLKEAFDKFCKAYSVDLEDLWPVFAKKGEIGLVDIRNKLIHGDPLPDHLIMHISIASQHLEYSLQRMIVRILNWDIAKTKLSPIYLSKNHRAIKDFPAAQNQISRYINNQELVGL